MSDNRNMRASEHDNHLGERVDDPLIDRLHWVIRQAIRVLAVLMVAVILWTVADVVLVLYEKLSSPPFLLLDLNDIFVVFAAFLAVLFAIGVIVLALGVTYWMVSLRPDK